MLIRGIANKIMSTNLREWERDIVEHNLCPSVVHILMTYRARINSITCLDLQHTPKESKTVINKHFLFVQKNCFVHRKLFATIQYICCGCNFPLLMFWSDVMFNFSRAYQAVLVEHTMVHSCNFYVQDIRPIMVAQCFCVNIFTEHMEWRYRVTNFGYSLSCLW